MGKPSYYVLEFKFVLIAPIYSEKRLPAISVLGQYLNAQKWQHAGGKCYVLHHYSYQSTKERSS
uniref:Uncharacterized protein n=1 Tax=Rhizophora mucronata TaxID=61149 RepID=A0A2P2PR66_RHIMU